MVLLRPVPAYPSETPLQRLSAAELFVVCTLRFWVADYRDGDCEYASWRRGFAHARISGEGAEGFDALLWVIAASARRTLDVRDVRCPKLGDDEARLLQLTGSLQQDRLAEAVAVLSDWLPPAGVRLALGPAQRLASALAERALRIPDRRTDPSMFDGGMPARLIAPASMLVH